MEPWGELLVGLAIVVGIAGVIVPILPGVLLVWAAVVTWGVVEGGAPGWGLAGVATVIAAASQVVKYVVPGRRLRSVGVPDRTLLIGGLTGVVGFFVVPVIGLLIGFVLGVYTSEWVRLRDAAAARAATGHAVRAAGVSILLELAAALLLAGGWLTALLLTA
ncbi:MAG: hypothetical protein K0Q93_196 [Nocardioidaceae bacterium]|jgi:uncharacterized protein YqgC (DUF456 family)|nr:hypothetical protein [Nocardioidaceae bacterium]